MPNYEFECVHCGHVQEAQRAAQNRDRPMVCAHCGRRMARVYSPFKHVYPCPIQGMTNAEIASTTERAKKEHGVWKG